ncbi:IMP dehydrogenase [Candidatus Dojkabacteria bacterium]|uniref:IMP dehydrogenase n=1 Tax=Candidatus Dojkabacteria bacterium TaxID=2099670 RepID=A0A955RGW2_9BACT|nr:IMP dehydrogenase [Candidatus Dojkabacteria bacterium]
MPRNLYQTIPNIISHVENKISSSSPVLEVATGNKNKLKEIERILTGYIIIGKDLKMDEIQSLDSKKVAEAKAIAAWEKNNFNPILIEDVSLEMRGLGGRPGTYANDFCSETEMRRLICEVWLKDKDRSATARITYALYDGTEVHIWEGVLAGKISETLRGSNGFGWDDMFIPDGEKQTFAEMTDKKKDSLSMRTMALEKFKKSKLDLTYPIFEIAEPYAQELERMRPEKLKDAKALKFAYSLECLGEKQKLQKNFYSDSYDPIVKQENKFYTRFIKKGDSSSLGLLLTDIDRKSLKTFRNGNPVLWQMGPERRQLALAQRAEYFLEHQNTKVHKILDEIDERGIEHRNNRRSNTVETALGTTSVGDITETKALKEIGYKKISSDKIVSRSAISSTGLYNKIGKHARSIYGIGSMPPISGWRDILVTAAIGHMPIFTHRNSLNAVDPKRQIDLINDAKKAIKDLKLPLKQQERAFRNIGAAVGCGNLDEEMKQIRQLYKKAGVKLFRIYTINGDPRVVEIARRIRAELGDVVEIFAGQIADKEQALELIAGDIKVDGLVFGHGGGMQCTSATNGMALTTLEEIYSITTDPRFNNVTIVAEGGVGRSVGGLFVLGVDLILSNQKFVRGTIELTDFFFQHKSGKLCHPYHGSASAPTMLIESSNEKLLEARMTYAGRAKKVEGKPGYMFFSEKAGSMAFYVDEFKHYAARTLADLGVNNMNELREFLKTNKSELLRIISTEAAYTGNPHADSN